VFSLTPVPGVPGSSFGAPFPHRLTFFFRHVFVPFTHRSPVLFPFRSVLLTSRRALFLRHVLVAFALRCSAFIRFRSALLTSRCTFVLAHVLPLLAPSLPGCVAFLSTHLAWILRRRILGGGRPRGQKGCGAHRQKGCGS
jgi:hypothetical protein